MQKRHDDLLTARIEEVTNKGWAFIAWWEAYLWYDQQKLGKNFWRDLKLRFDEHNKVDRERGELHFRQALDGVLLINGDGLKPISARTGPGAPPEDLEF